MFPFPAIISASSTPLGNLFLSFHDGSITDEITPSRVFTLDSNAYVGYPYRYGSKFANTSLIANNRSSGQGLYCTDMTGLGSIGGTGVSYTVEFWASNLVPTGTARVRLLSGANTVLDVNGSGLTGIGCTFHGQNFPLAIASYPKRTQWNHFAFVRELNTARMYFNGVKIYDVSFASSNLVISTIQLGAVTSGVPASNQSTMDLNLNYFGITLGAKYSANFNPLTDTGATYYYPETETRYCL